MKGELIDLTQREYEKKYEITISSPKRYKAKAARNKILNVLGVYVQENKICAHFTKHNKPNILQQLTFPNKHAFYDLFMCV